MLIEISRKQSAFPSLRVWFSENTPTLSLLSFSPISGTGDKKRVHYVSGFRFTHTGKKRHRSIVIIAAVWKLLRFVS